MHCIIDADIVAFRAAASCEPTETKFEREDINLALWRCKDVHERIIRETNATSFVAYLGGTSNFRKQLCIHYKAQRKEMIPPLYLNEVKEFYITELGAKVTDGYEADDAIGIEHQRCMNEGIECVVVSIDKDLLQLEGLHYNHVKRQFIEVAKSEAAYNLYILMLIGDTADNIKGVKGIGAKKAPGYLDGKTAEEMHEIVKELYNDEARFELNHRLFSVLRTEEEYESMELNGSC